MPSRFDRKRARSDTEDEDYDNTDVAAPQETHTDVQSVEPLELLAGAEDAVASSHPCVLCSSPTDAARIGSALRAVRTRLLQDATLADAAKLAAAMLAGDRHCRMRQALAYGLTRGTCRVSVAALAEHYIINHYPLSPLQARPGRERR